MPTPTIYDVARQAGVSITTVSRVLNSPQRVKAVTHDRVMEAIEQLGYVPKIEARARARRSPGLMGVMTPYFTAPSFVQRLRGIASAVATTNMDLVVYPINSQRQINDYLTMLPLRGTLDGLIIISLPINGSTSERLIQHGLETVLVEYPMQELTSIEIDDYEGGRMAAEYLVGKNHQRCAFIGLTEPPEYGIHPVSFRLEGFRDALSEMNIELPDSYIGLAEYTQEDSRRAARRMLGLDVPPTAIFAATDFQAMAALNVARQMGRSVPQDVAILGFDDLDMADYVGLTTIRQPLDESGKIAVELLLSRINSPDRSRQHVQLPLKIIERETV
jgi:DNA-binding LacI/PurR family transcriptional regulator